MTSSRRTQLVLLAASLAILAIVSAAWSVSSPGAIRRVGEAVVILVGSVCAFRQCRSVPSRTPLVLFATLVGLGVVLIRPLLGPHFPMVLTILVGIIWLVVWIARWRLRTWTA